MLTVVLVLNGVIALLCLYVAWQLRRIRQVLAKVADTLTAVERSTHAVLHPAPIAIGKGQGGTRKLRQQYRKLEAQLLRLEQVLALWQRGQRAWQPRSTGARRLKR